VVVRQDVPELDARTRRLAGATMASPLASSESVRVEEIVSTAIPSSSVAGPA